MDMFPMFPTPHYVHYSLLNHRIFSEQSLYLSHKSPMEGWENGHDIGILLDNRGVGIMGIMGNIGYVYR